MNLAFVYPVMLLLLPLPLKLNEVAAKYTTLSEPPKALAPTDPASPPALGPTAKLVIVTARQPLKSALRMDTLTPTALISAHVLLLLPALLELAEYAPT